MTKKIIKVTTTPYPKPKNYDKARAAIRTRMKDNESLKSLLKRHEKRVYILYGAFIASVAFLVLSFIYIVSLGV